MSSSFELVRGNAPPHLRPAFPLDGYKTRQTDWQRITAVISKHWKSSAMFTIGVVMLVSAATLAMKPVYEPEGRVQIDPPGSAVFSLDSTTGTTSDSEYITTEAQKLQTDGLALATIRSLHLNSNPEFVGNVMAQNPANPADAQQIKESEGAALRSFSSHLTVRRDPSSRLVAVSFASHDPKTSAGVVNS